MLREITPADFDAFWPTFSAVIQAQETYAFDADMTKSQAFELWCQLPDKTYVFVEGDKVLGTYYIKANAKGPSRHICNCGYMVASEARGKGVARQMCDHSQKVALQLGFDAMQFNCVVSTNEIAVNLWKTMGYEIVGTLPKAYNHRRFGLVDCYVMYKWLA